MNFNTMCHELLLFPRIGGLTTDFTCDNMHCVEGPASPRPGNIPESPASRAASSIKVTSSTSPPAVKSQISRPYCSPSSMRGCGEAPTRWGGIVSPRGTHAQMAEVGSLQPPSFFLHGSESDSDSRLKTRPSRHSQNWRETTYTTDVCFMVNCV